MKDRSGIRRLTDSAARPAAHSTGSFSLKEEPTVRTALTVATRFPDSESVNRALRMLVNTAAAAAAGAARRRPGASNPRAKSPAGKRAHLAARGGLAQTVGH